MGRLSVLLFLLLIVSMDVKSQSSKSIPYQAVLRNAMGFPLSEKDVKVRTTLIDSIATGAALYKEEFAVKTNPFGLFTINIGMGTKLEGNYSNIQWGQNDKFLKIEIDSTNTGAGFVEMSIQQLSSVPFALYAAKAGNLELGKMPVVTTDSIHSISYRSAQLVGSFLQRGSKVVFAKGFCLAEHENPSEDDSVLLTGVSSGSYRMLLSNLSPGKTYHVRAFASSAAGTSYGSDLSFTTLSLKVPVVRTDTVLNVSLNAALFQASLIEDGGTDVTERGFCWSEHALPTLDDSTRKISLTGNYSVTIQTLKAATTYYLRAYAKNAEGVAFGSEKTFTTNNYTLPVVTTSEATSIQYRSAKVMGQIQSLGNGAISERGICYSTTDQPTTAASKIPVNTSANNFEQELVGLEPGTTYYARAYVISAGGTAYGNTISFATKASSLASVSTLSVYAISTTSAASGGIISDAGGLDISSKGICWSNSVNPTITDAHAEAGEGTGNFNSMLSGLTINTRYYVRAYAVNSLGISYGNEISFQSSSILIPPGGVPLIGTSPVTYNDSTVTVGGFLGGEGGATVSRLGICWNTTGNPSVSDSVWEYAPAGLGYFTITRPKPQTCRETFYFKAFAENSSGLAYGQNQYSYQTGNLPIPREVVASEITSNSARLTTSILIDGGCSVLERGICWGLTVNPSLTSSYFSGGTGIGEFTTVASNLQMGRTYYARSYVKTILGELYGQQISFTIEDDGSLYIGKSYAGGIIFYLDSTKEHGMVCAPSDQLRNVKENYIDYSGNPMLITYTEQYTNWGCSGLFIGASDTSFGAGQKNTITILASCKSENCAAKVCDDLVLDGYSDWFLPSIGELKYMYYNLYLNGIGGFRNDSFPTHSGYASSSECTGYSAWSMMIGCFWFDPNGNCNNKGANDNYGREFVIRAVRKF